MFLGRTARTAIRRAAGCEGKTPYETRPQALRVVRQMSRRHHRHHKDNGSAHVYRCRYCDAWHIGHAGGGHAGGSS